MGSTFSSASVCVCMYVWMYINENENEEKVKWANEEKQNTYQLYTHGSFFQVYDVKISDWNLYDELNEKFYPSSLILHPQWRII